LIHLGVELEQSGDCVRLHVIDHGGDVKPRAAWLESAANRFPGILGNNAAVYPCRPIIGDTEELPRLMKPPDTRSLSGEGHPDEFARVDLFLTCDLASYVSGALRPSDGGFLASKPNPTSNGCSIA
jgi:hypothetical protein